MDFHLHQGELKLDISGSSVTDPEKILTLKPIADWIDRATATGKEEKKQVEEANAEGNPPAAN